MSLAATRRMVDLATAPCFCAACLFAPEPELPGLEILDELGRGGMGIVYRARHTGLAREVAVKVLASPEAELRRRFVREAQLLARVAHPNVVAIHDAGERGGTCYLVMELVRGTTLAVRGVLGVREVLRCADAICDALAAAHRLGIVHRDVKPSNVLVADDGTVKLADFGVAALVDRDTWTQRIGTPGFMAPEALAGAAPHPATDVYAVGRLIVRMTDGALPPCVARVVDRALAADPRRRPSIDELRAALARTRRRRATRQPWLAAALAGSLAVVEVPQALFVPPLDDVPVAPAIALRSTTIAHERAPAAVRVPRRGTVEIRATPWALVSIDGGPVRRVEPPAVAVELTAGRHVFELSNPVSGRRARRVAMVAPATELVIAADLARVP